MWRESGVECMQFVGGFFGLIDRKTWDKGESKMIFTCNTIQYSWYLIWNNNLFLWSPFITVTKAFSAKECTMYCTLSRVADTVILWCHLSQEVNTWPLPISAHQATQSLYECLCAQKPLWRRSHVRHTTDQPIIQGWGWQGKGYAERWAWRGEWNERKIKRRDR